MTIYKENSYKGKQLLHSANNNIGFTLDDVYTTYSKDKERAWEYCYSQFANDSESYNFRIISANTYGFSVAWDTENGVRIETPKNSYFVDCM